MFLKFLLKFKFNYKTVILLMLLLLQFCVFLPLMFLENPFSVYFRLSGLSYEAMASKVNTMNRKRAQEATEYFKSKSPGESLKYYASVANRSSIFMAVAIVTVSRREGTSKNDSLGYLLQSSSSVDVFARTDAFINSAYVFVCNVDVHPEDHKPAKYLKSYLPYSERYGSSSFSVIDMELPDESGTYRKKIHKKSHVYVKENFDYSYCMKVAHSLNPEYILMVEDDAVPHKDLAVVLKYYLETHLRQKKDNVGYLKLYYPEKWQGFAYERTRVLELISIGCVGGVIFMLCLCAFGNNHRMTTKPVIAYFILGFLYSILTAQVVGRQNVMELRRLSKVLYQFRPAPGCCTPAMMYPSSVVEPLASHLTSVHPSTHTDLAIAGHFRRKHLPAYQLEPNLFYHIGKYSSLTESDKEPEHFLIDI